MGSSRDYFNSSHLTPKVWVALGKSFHLFKKQQKFETATGKENF